MAFADQFGKRIGILNYQGTWNASANTPHLTSGSGRKGYYYIISTAGDTVLDGESGWDVGDWAIFNGSVWQQINSTNSSRNFSVIGNLTISGLTTSFLEHVVSSGPLTLTSSSPYRVVFTGVSSTCVVNLGNALNSDLGRSTHFFNSSSALISVVNNSSSVLFYLYPGYSSTVLLRGKSTADGLWSYDSPPYQLSGSISAASFTGNPRKYTVSFTYPFANTNYRISVTGQDTRIWTFESKTASGFTISSNAATALTSTVDWSAVEDN